MAYDGYRASFDPPGFNPNASTSNSYTSSSSNINNINTNNGGGSTSSSANISSTKPSNAPYPGYLQPSYGEYPVEQDPSSHPPPPPPPPPSATPAAAAAATTASAIPCGISSTRPGSRAADAVKQPFSRTSSQPEPPTPRVPDPNYPSTDLIAQVTAAVIQQLRAPGPGNAPPPPSHPSQQQAQQQTVYQPPTPALSQSSYNRQSPNPNSLSPPIATSPYGPPQPSIPGQPDLSNAPAQSSYPPISSRVDGSAYNGPQVQNPADNGQQQTTSPGIDRARGSSIGSFNGGRNGTNPSKGPSRHSTVTNEAISEKPWGTLFDKDDMPTSRAGQLLRGIALHMIETYPPGNTLVITPEKLQKFYRDHRVSSDSYPWQDIFDNRTSSISRLFRSLSIEHHLVQDQLDERPDIPGLTPRGFERWMSMMIQAHPEREFERVKNIVQNIPITNPDDRTERFPKELRRKLFPQLPDYDIKETLDRWITTHCHVELTQGMLGGPPMRQPRAKSTVDNTSTGIPSRPASTDVRPRQFPPAATVEDAIDEDDHVIVASADVADVDAAAQPVQPIERERKPYSMPGGTKGYREDTSPHPTTSTSRHPDSNSGVSFGKKHVVVYSGDDDDDFSSPRDDVNSKYSSSHHGNTHPQSHAHTHPHQHSHPHTHDDSKRHHGRDKDRDRDRDRDRDLDWDGDKSRRRTSWGSDEDFYRNPVSDRDRGRKRTESRTRFSDYDKFWEYR
ncbi:conserved hypothetical protein [Trichophyton verrucosum HKI 0517]|uniref:DUF7514 domain-containing protein n=1 Tax=Trichophyton verrucosum (strain HKI 0517) TaxID=663202 RepID=D4DI70_TRIVH|nr:uncharacterized protein TRV_06878 [Trichophyton verrucosum HKI 0517]EFE38454.1 conserved hypothetical protein [Trichophyton verrucosum HKI 0517]